MLWVNGKKINTAFGRLRDRRAAVGDTTRSETPEEEAKRVEQDLKMAAQSGDVAKLIRIIAQSGSLTVADYISKTVGNLFFLYYTYVDKFHTHPVTIDDLIDGLLYLDAKAYILKQAKAEQEDKK